MHLRLGQIWQAIRPQAERSENNISDIAPDPPRKALGILDVNRPPRPQSPFSDSSVIADTKTPLATGKVATVYTYRFQTETGEVTKVFKPETKSVPKNVIPAGVSGIPNNRPKLCERAIASSKIDQLLGFNVIAETHPAIVEGQQGIVMEHIASKSPEILLKPNDGILQERLIALQLEDSIVGQVDRTAENYLIQVDSKGNTIGLKGIDNDFAFGKTAKGEFQAGCPVTVDFPPIIDETQRNIILRFKSGHLERVMKESGLTDGEEIEAAKKRLLALQDHIQDSTKCRIIKPEEWGSTEVTSALLGEPLRTSYFQRDIVHLSTPKKPTAPIWE